MREFIDLVESLSLANEADIIEKAAEEFFLSEPSEFEYPEFNIEIARAVAKERLNLILTRVHDGALPIWREVTALPNWRPEDRDLGVCWSWNEEDAFAHHGNGGGRTRWLLHGEVSINDVDWVNTVALNCIILEEAEVRLLGDRHVLLKWVQKDGAEKITINKRLSCGPGYKGSGE